MKISPKKYAQALADVLDSSAETADAKKVIKNFLKILQRRGDMKNLEKILRAFELEWRERNDIVKMSVEYPNAFSKSVEDLESRVVEMLGSHVDMESRPAEGLIGGFRVKVDDLLIDATVVGMLNKLSLKLM